MIKPTTDQEAILASTAKFNVLVTPRRWGKSTLCWMAADPSQTALWIAPNLMMVEGYRLADSHILTDGTRRIGDYSLKEWIGRRKWSLCLIEELPMIDTNWFDAFFPELIDHVERFIITGTPHGFPPGKTDFLREFLHMSEIHTPNWAGWHFTSSPFLDPKVVEELRGTVSESAYKTEFQGNFIDIA